MKYTQDISFYSKKRKRFSVFLAYWTSSNIWRRGAFRYKGVWLEKFIPNHIAAINGTSQQSTCNFTRKRSISIKL